MDRRHVLGLVGAAFFTLVGMNAAADHPNTKATKAACSCCGTGCECAKCSRTAASMWLKSAEPGCGCCKGLACCLLDKRAEKSVAAPKKSVACCPSPAKTAAPAPTQVK